MTHARMGGDWSVLTPSKICRALYVTWCVHVLARIHMWTNGKPNLWNKIRLNRFTCSADTTTSRLPGSIFSFPLDRDYICLPKIGVVWCQRRRRLHSCSSVRRVDTYIITYTNIKLAKLWLFLLAPIQLKLCIWSFGSKLSPIDTCTVFTLRFSSGLVVICFWF